MKYCMKRMVPVEPIVLDGTIVHTRWALSRTLSFLSALHGQDGEHRI